jgi:hypothetical protein
MSTWNKTRSTALQPCWASSSGVRRLHVRHMPSRRSTRSPSDVTCDIGDSESPFGLKRFDIAIDADKGLEPADVDYVVAFPSGPEIFVGRPARVNVYGPSTTDRKPTSMGGVFLPPGTSTCRQRTSGATAAGHAMHRADPTSGRARKSSNRRTRMYSHPPDQQPAKRQRCWSRGGEGTLFETAGIVEGAASLAAAPHACSLPQQRSFIRTPSRRVAAFSPG